MLSIVIIILIIHPTYQLEIIQAALASTVELPCSVTSQNIELTNPAKIVWIRDDQAEIVSLDSTITVRDHRLNILSIDRINCQERILRISNVEEEDRGLYRCIYGEITLNEILLDVLIPPRIVSHSPEHMHMTIREGYDAQFSCAATGHPMPMIVWHVNGLLRSERVTMIESKNESIFILRNVSRFDSGRVDCSASNTLSTVNRQFLLNVKYKPIVTVPFHSSYFRLYDSVTITCQTCSVPSVILFDIFRPKQFNPIMKGIKNRFDKILNYTCQQLTITISLNDSSLFGLYVCRAKNSLGVNHAKFILREKIQLTKYITDHQSSSTDSIIINLSSSLTFRTDEMFKQNIQSNRATSQTITEKNQLYRSLISFIIVFVMII